MKPSSMRRVWLTLSSSAAAHLGGALFDQRADIFHPPGRDALAKLHRFRKAPILDTGPPGRLADRDRPVGCKNRQQAEKACLRKFSDGHSDSTPSSLEWNRSMKCRRLLGRIRFRRNRIRFQRCCSVSGRGRSSFPAWRYFRTVSLSKPIPRE